MNQGLAVFSLLPRIGEPHSLDCAFEMAQYTRELAKRGKKLTTVPSCFFILTKMFHQKKAFNYLGVFSGIFKAANAKAHTFIVIAIWDPNKCESNTSPFSV